MAYKYVPADQFTPESRNTWKAVGAVDSWKQEEEGIVDKFTLNLESGHKIYIYLFSHRTFRVRFNPDPEAPYVQSLSPATEVERIEAYEIKVEEVNKTLRIKTDYLELRVNMNKYSLSVFRGNQLIHADPEDYGLVYIPHNTGGESVAQFKRAPKNAIYSGFGEKGGATLDKRRVPKQHFYGQLNGSSDEYMGSALTFFNYDNFGYAVPDLTPSGEVQGPLNPNEPLYQSSPFLVEYNPLPNGEFSGPSYAYGILLDNTSQSYMNFRQQDQYYFGALHGELDYYFFAGDHVADVLYEFTTLTGRTHIKPKHILGYHQGGYGGNYNNRWKIMEVATKYRQWNIPIDGLHIDVDIQDNFRTFTHSEKKFPRPREMFDALHSMGYKCSTNITPIISANVDENGKHTPYKALDSGKELDVFVRDIHEDGSGTGDYFIGNVNYGRGYFTYGHYPDLGRRDVQKWWGDQYKDLLDWGLDFIWQDMTTPAMKASCHQDPCPLLSFPMDLMLSDNEESRYHDEGEHHGKQPFAKIRCLYNYNLCKATYKGLERLQPDKRHFIIARGGFVGVHRYAGLWTGDSTSNWEFVQINIPLILTISLSAQPVSGCDVGGFCAAYDGQIVSPELLTRWTIMGAFLPWFRNHYDNYNKPYQEPYCYEEPVPTICRKYIEMRYRLIHYLYDAMYNNSQTGLPICRPMFLDEYESGKFTHDAQAIQNHSYDFNGYVSNRMDDQFFVGKDLLIAPVVHPGQTYRPVYLPAGSSWFVYTDNKRAVGEDIAGGREIDFYAPWDKPDVDNCAVFAREGAIIPTREVEQWVGEKHSVGLMNPLTMTIYPGRDTMYILYQDDDGETNRAEKKQEYRLTTITTRGIPRGRQVKMTRTHDNFNPPEAFFYVAFLGVEDVTRVTIGDSTLSSTVGTSEEIKSKSLSVATSNAFYINKALKTLFVKVFDDNRETVIEVLL